MWNRHKKRSQTFPFLILIMGLLTLTLASFSQAKASGENQFGIQPANPTAESSKSGYFIVKGQPGEIINDTVAVSNSGPNPITLLIFPVDAVTGPQSGALYNKLEIPRKNVGAWITLDKTELKIDARSQVIIPFTIKVPKEALTGQHLGGIVVQEKSDGTEAKPTGNFGINVITRAVSPVKVNVGGATNISSLKINSAQVTEVNTEPTLSLNLLNDGTEFIKPKGDVTLTDAAGKPVMTSKLVLDTILPKDNINYPVAGKLPGPGTYKVHASLDFGGSGPAVYDGQVEIKSPSTPAATMLATSQPAVSNSQATTNGQTVSNSQTVASADASSNPVTSVPLVGTVTNNTPVTSGSDTNSMLVGILIGVAAVFGLITLGLGGYLVATRRQKPVK